MGWRSTRVCLDRKIFQRNSSRRSSSPREGTPHHVPDDLRPSGTRAAKALYRECCDELAAKGVEIPETKIGCMIEVPAAVVMVDELAKEVDFFRIGTNDLIQFTLAVDRTNELIADMFEPHHPAILLNMIDKVVTAAHRQGITVGVCGEMSADPMSTLVLVGLDIDELPLTPWSIAGMQKTHPLHKL